MSRTSCPRMLAVVSAALFALTPGSSARDTVAPDQLEPGDRCVGKTVFEGSRVDSFDLTILGVVHGTSPGGDVIIARAEDDRLERTGILQGMSGSPVYLEGRLVGAVAGTWPFAEEPVAAITPIGEMLPALDALDRPRGDGGGGAGAIRGSDLVPPLERRSSRIGWVARACGLTRPRGSDEAPPSLGAYAGLDVARLGVPLAVSGGDTRLLSRLASLLRPIGLVPVAGPAGAGDAAQLLQAGSSVGVQLVGGDMVAAAIGTVTHVEGDQVLAFGHPLFNSGWIEMPMVGAHVHALIPLQSASFKYASTTDVIGAVLVDRRRAVAGRVGGVAPTVPLKVEVGSEGGPGSACYSFDVVRSRALTSFFSGMAVSEAVAEAAKGVGPASIVLRAVVSTPADTIEYENVFFTEDPVFRTGGELGTLLDVIYGNSIETIEPTEIAVDVTVSGAVGRTEIVRVEADRSTYRPGETVRVTVTLRSWQGPEFERAVDLALPSSVPEGEVRLRVGGASSFHEWEADRLGEGLRPRSYAQLLDLIDRSRPGNTIVAQVVAPGPGLSLLGSEMREIPGRAALVLATSATSGAVDPTDGVMVVEGAVAVEGEVQGDHEIVLRITDER